MGEQTFSKPQTVSDWFDIPKAEKTKADPNLFDTKDVSRIEYWMNKDLLKIKDLKRREWLKAHYCDEGGIDVYCNGVKYRNSFEYKNGTWPKTIPRLTKKKWKMIQRKTGVKTIMVSSYGHILIKPPKKNFGQRNNKQKITNMDILKYRDELQNKLTVVNQIIADMGIKATKSAKPAAKSAAPTKRKRKPMDAATRAKLSAAAKARWAAKKK